MWVGFTAKSYTHMDIELCDVHRRQIPPATRPFTLNPIVRPASLPGIWHSGVQGASKELVNLLWFLCGFSTSDLVSDEQKEEEEGSVSGVNMRQEPPATMRFRAATSTCSSEELRLAT